MLRSCPLLFPATILKFLFTCSFPSLRLEPAWDFGLHRKWGDLQPDCVTILRHISWRLFFFVKPLPMLTACRWRCFPMAVLFPWSASGSSTLTRSAGQLLNKGEEILVLCTFTHVLHLSRSLSCYFTTVFPLYCMLLSIFACLYRSIVLLTAHHLLEKWNVHKNIKMLC